MDVLAECPLLIPQTADKTFYNGYITVSGHDFRVAIRLREPGKLRGAKIDCEWKLQHLLRNHLSIVKQRLQQSTTLVAFLVELKSIIERQLETSSTAPRPPKFYTRLLSEIEEIGWQRLCFISENFDQVHLSQQDAKNRNHVLKVQLHPQHPDVSPDLVTDLPSTFTVTWNTQLRLCDVLREFERCLAGYQELWDVLDDLDAHTWILEPENPSRAALHRRIALGQSASVSVMVCPHQPRQLPECRFMGADQVINPLREKLNKNLEKWDITQNLLLNLQKVLEVDFPSPSNTKKEDVSASCSICYAYRLNGELPDQMCDDGRCQQPFHQACLYEWLRGLPSSRQSFNMLFGECPYCGKAITVKMTAAVK